MENRDNVNPKTSVQQDNHPAQVQAALYSGPLPPPALLQAYGQVDPGYPERIMKQFEANAKHVRETEKEEQKIEAAGQVMALLIAFVLALISVFAIYKGQGLAGATALGAIGVAFLRRKN